VGIVVREWTGYVRDDAEFSFVPGSRVIDVGCGEGVQVLRLSNLGVWVCGVDPSRGALKRGREKGLRLVRGEGEHLPFRRGAFDGVICKVALPYTDERSTVGEIGGVLRYGGTAFVVGHGAGYYLRYLLRPSDARHAIYAARTLLNTWLWALTGHRLPGFLGDTCYQSRGRLLKWYEASGLKLEHELGSPRYLGCPVFIYHRLKKVTS